MYAMCHWCANSPFTPKLLWSWGCISSHLRVIKLDNSWLCTEQSFLHNQFSFYKSGASPVLPIIHHPHTVRPDRQQEMTPRCKGRKQLLLFYTCICSKLSRTRMEHAAATAVSCYHGYPWTWCHFVSPRLVIERRGKCHTKYKEGWKSAVRTVAGKF